MSFKTPGFSTLIFAALFHLTAEPQPAKKNLHLFLLIGQSNMSGRAAIGSWLPGTTYYKETVLRAKQAQAYGMKSFDGIHFDTQGQYAMGEGYADQVFALVYKNAVAVGRAPRPQGNGIVTTRSLEGIRFQVPPGVTRIRLFDIQGHPAGMARVDRGYGFLARASLASGVYSIRAEGGSGAVSGKLLVP